MGITAGIMNFIILFIDGIIYMPFNFLCGVLESIGMDGVASFIQTMIFPFAS